MGEPVKVVEEAVNFIFQTGNLSDGERFSVVRVVLDGILAHSHCFYHCRPSMIRISGISSIFFMAILRG
jgi:hypothetical protein